MTEFFVAVYALRWVIAFVIGLLILALVAVTIAEINANNEVVEARRKRAEYEARRRETLELRRELLHARAAVARLTREKHETVLRHRAAMDR